MPGINQKQLRELLQELSHNKEKAASLQARVDQLILDGVSEDHENIRFIQNEMSALKDEMCLDQDGHVNFKQLLVKNGYSTNLSDVSFFLPPITVAKSHGVGESIFHAKDILKEIDFGGCNFKKCDFSWVNMNGSNLAGCKFDQCTLNNTIFRKCQMQNAAFLYQEQDPRPMTDCDFSESDCSSMTVKNGHFQYGTFYRTNFSNAKMPFTRFEESTFVESNPQDMVFDQSINLTFQDCAIAQSVLDSLKRNGYLIEDQGRQKVAIVWKADWPGHTAAKLLKYLKAQGITPVKVDYSPVSMDSESLNEDLNKLLNTIRETDDESPIPQQLVRLNGENPEQTPTMSAMRTYAQGFIELSDGLMIPGGLDLEGELEDKEYTKLAQHHTVHTEDNYIRSVLEVQLLSLQEKRGAPVMGICRGAQMINMFYGGTSHEHIESNVNVVQALEALPETNGIISHIYRRSPQAGAGISFHHQAMDRLGQGLQEVIAVEQEVETPTGPKTQHVTKAAEGIYQQPVLAIQYHPEVYTDDIYREILGEENPQLLDAFVDTVRAHKSKHMNVLSEINKLGSLLAEGEALKPSQVKAASTKRTEPTLSQSHEAAWASLSSKEPEARIKKPKKPRNINHSELSALLKEIKQKQSQLEEYSSRIQQLEGSGDPEAIARLQQEIKSIQESLCMNNEGRIQFNQLLKDRGFSTTVKNRNFSLRGNTIKASVGAGSSVMHAYDNLKSIDFEDIVFEQCKFPDCNFDGSSFTNVTLNQCDLNRAVFKSCDITETKITSCDMEDTDFSYSSMEGVAFKSCHLTYANFFDATLEQCQLSSTTIEKASMLGAEFIDLTADEKSQLKDCALTQEQHDTLTAQKVTLSTDPNLKKVGIVWKANWPGHTAAKLYKILKEKGVVPIKIEYEPPTNQINGEELNIQINILLEQARDDFQKDKDQFDLDMKVFDQQTQDYQTNLDKFENGEITTAPKPPRRPSPPKSIPQRLVTMARENSIDLSEVSKTLANAKLYASHIDGLMMPGGLDLEGAIFNEDYDPTIPEHHTVHTEGNFHRTFLELCLVSEQENKGAPFMGICRGAQLANGYYGGKTAEHVDDQVNVVQSLEPKEHATGVIAGIIRNSDQDQISAISFHHQAMETAGHGLDEVMSIEMQVQGQDETSPTTTQHIIKALEGTTQQAVILTQFHPEVKEADTLNDQLLNAPNSDLFDAFIDSVATRQAKKSGLLEEIQNLGQALNGSQMIRPSDVTKRSLPKQKPGLLRNITQEEFKALIKASSEYNEVKTPGALKLKDLLKEHGYSPTLNNIDLSILSITIRHPLGAGVKVTHGLERLKGIDYSGLTLNNCSAEGCNFSDSKFNNVHINNCNFNKAVFENCEFSKTKIVNSHFDDGNFAKSQFEKMDIENCQFHYTDFSSTSFESSVRIDASSFEACAFVNAKDEGAQFSSTVLKDCILPSKDRSFFAQAQKEDSDPPRPVMGILWEPHHPGHTGYKVYDKLKAEGAIPLRVSYLPENEVNLGIDEDAGLEAQVKRALSRYQQLVEEKSPIIENMSRAQFILNHARENPESNPDIMAIIKRAKDFCSQTHGFVIPGGADIPPDLYGQEAHEKSSPEKDYMRSILEFAVIQEQKNEGKPLMGICRGCQIINVFHGGDLNQRVYDSKLLSWMDKHKRVFNPKTRAVARYLVQGIGKMETVPGTAGTIPGILDSSPWVVSCHNQAIGEIGDGISPGDALEVVAIHQGVVKAAQSQYGAPVMMTQFHPEISNETMSEMAHSSKAKNKVLNTIGGGILMQMSSKKNIDFIKAIVESAKTKQKHQNQLIQEIKGLGEQTVSEGVDKTPLIKPSSLKQKTSAVSKSPIPTQINALTSRYRFERRQHHQKRANRFPFLRKTIASVYAFFDRNIINRKAEKTIKALEKQASSISRLDKKIQLQTKSPRQKSSKSLEKNKLNLLNAENQCNVIIEKYLSVNASSPFAITIQDAIQTNHSSQTTSAPSEDHFESVDMSTFSTQETIRDFVANPKNRSTLLGKAFVHAASLPVSPRAVFDALERYEQTQQQRPNEAEQCLKSIQAINLRQNEARAKIFIRALNPEYYELIDGIKAHEKIHEGCWSDLSEVLGQLPIQEDDNMKSFIEELVLMCKEIQEIDDKIESTLLSHEKEALQLAKDQLVLTLSDQLNVGPFSNTFLYKNAQQDPVAKAVQAAIEQNHGALPTNESWSKLKDTLTEIGGTKAQTLIASLDEQLLEQNMDTLQTINQYIEAHPNQTLAQALNQHSDLEGLINNPEQWDDFLRAHPEQVLELTNEEAMFLGAMQRKQEYDNALPHTMADNPAPQSTKKTRQKAVINLFGNQSSMAHPTGYENTKELEQKVKQRSAFEVGETIEDPEGKARHEMPKSNRLKH